MNIPFLSRWFAKTCRYAPGVWWRGIRITRDMDRVIIGRGHHIMLGAGFPINNNAVVVDLHLETPVTFWMVHPWSIRKVRFEGFEGTVVADRLNATTIREPVIQEVTWQNIRRYVHRRIEVSFEQQK